MSKKQTWEEILDRDYGRLSPLREVAPHERPSGGVRRKVLCRCECGAVKEYLLENLNSGNSTNCGCVRKKTLSKLKTTHGESKSSLHNTWCHIKSRCLKPSNPDFERYGGRGITLQESWASDYAAFASSIRSCLGDCPSEGHSLDRIDNNGNYEEGNLRWATQKEQCNNKANNHFLTIDGETKTITEWVETSELSASLVYGRINKYGWSPEKALTTPAHGGRHHIEFRGERLRVSQWAEKTGIAKATLKKRLGKYGWSVEKALTTPAQKRCPKN